MRTSRAALVATALVSSSLLAACGGGGGSSPVVTPTFAPGGATTTAVVRSDAQTVLVAAKLLGSDGYFPGGPPLGAMSVARLVRSRAPRAVANCSSGGTSGVGSVSFDETTDAQGNDTQNYRDYYDANCAQPERVATLIYPAGTSVGSPSGSITGSTTEYSHAGTVIGYATLLASWTPSSVTVRTVDSNAVGGGVVGQSGATCDATSTTAVTCGTASFQTVAGTTTGVAGTIAETLVPNTQNGGGTVTAQLSATTYGGAGLTARRTVVGHRVVAERRHADGHARGKRCRDVLRLDRDVGDLFGHGHDAERHGVGLVRQRGATHDQARAERNDARDDRHRR